MNVCELFHFVMQSKGMNVVVQNNFFKNLLFCRLIHL